MSPTSDRNTVSKQAGTTVSDTAALNPSTDKSGPLLAQTLRDDVQGRYSVYDTRIVKDDLAAIQHQVLQWSSRKINLVLTSGGTGFSPSDVTPEAIRPLLVKEAPGLSQLMISSSLRITPLAALSRPVCGTTHTGTLVITLPGSPKGAKENLEALLEVLPHALRLSSGESSRKLHQDPANTNVGHSHGAVSHKHAHTAPKPHTQSSSDPSLGASRRHRSSPYLVIAMLEAMQLIFEKTPVLGTETQTVRPDTVMHHILAEEVQADSAIPASRTTNVDGYAVRSADGPGVYPVLTAKTHPMPYVIQPRTIYRVNTGGPIPDGADAVVMVEDTALIDTHKVSQSDGLEGTEEEKTVEIKAEVKAGENVRQPGSDVQKGDIVLRKGTLISTSGGEVGTLSFVGRSHVAVYRRPTVAVLSTGNEIVDAGSNSDDVKQHSMYDTNRPALLTALRSAAYKTVDLGICGDTVRATIDALLAGAEQADVIIATGGTSMGEADLLKPVIERHLQNGKTWFGRVAMKPGLPTTFATFSHKGKDKIVFSLPGNPASALVTFNVFVLPCLRKLSGYHPEKWVAPRLKARLTAPLSLDQNRPEFHRVHIQTCDTTPYLQATSTGGQRSSRASSMAIANGYACLPAAKDGAQAPQLGDLVDVMLIGSL